MQQPISRSPDFDLRLTCFPESRARVVIRVIMIGCSMGPQELEQAFRGHILACSHTREPNTLNPKPLNPKLCIGNYPG